MRILLLDGDVFAFVAAAAAQRDLSYPDGHVVRWSDEGEAIGILNDLVEKVMAKLETREYLFFLTDPEVNWRTQVYADYKGNRVGGDRPQLLTYLKNYCLTKHSAILWPGMEADDLMGMWATDTTGKLLDPIFKEPVIVSKDKDMRSVPGMFYDLGKIDKPDYEVETISVEAADHWHMIQTLAGDKVDNYPGCPGIGVDRAEDILSAKRALRPEHGFITRGKNKGQRTTKWVGYPSDDTWRIVVTHYEKAGKTEEDALQMARVARICRSEDYDFKNNMVILWGPYDDNGR